jgi:nucleotide-binding universal stress UspA family protein
MAVELARLNGARVILLAVIDDTFPYPDIFSFHSPNKDYYKTIRDRALEMMTRLVEEAPPEVRTEIVVSRGKPWKVIVEVAEQERCELIIMKTRGSRGLEHAFLGSVTDKVLRAAPCPVLVVPMRRSDTPPDEGSNR